MFENAPSVASHLALRRKDLPKKLGHHVETRAPEARGSVLRYRGISSVIKRPPRRTTAGF